MHAKILHKPTFFFTTSLSLKALVFILLIAHHITVDGKASPAEAEAKISPHISTSVTVSLGLETESPRLNNRQ